MNVQQLSTLAASVIALVGLIVLVALGKVSADVGVPLIAALGGAHVGASAALSTPPAPASAGVLAPAAGSQRPADPEAG